MNMLHWQEGLVWSKIHMEQSTVPWPRNAWTRTPSAFKTGTWCLQSVLLLCSAQYTHGLLGVSLASLSDSHTEAHLCEVLTWCSTLLVSCVTCYLFWRILDLAMPVTALLFYCFQKMLLKFSLLLPNSSCLLFDSDFVLVYLWIMSPVTLLILT